MAAKHKMAVHVGKMSLDRAIEHAVSAVERDGVVVLEAATHKEQMRALKSEIAHHLEKIEVAAVRNRTKRVASHILRDTPTYRRLVTHPLPLALCQRLLKPNCWRYQPSCAQAIEVCPGAQRQNSHQDDDIYQMPHPHVLFELSMMWAIDDFTLENGATIVVPGSHLWCEGRRPNDFDPTLDAVMPSGSLLVWAGSTWHAAGANSSNASRVGAYVGYSLGWLAQEDNLYLALPPDAARCFEEPLHRLIGYGSEVYQEIAEPPDYAASYRK